jgi:hypothetical protein
LWVMLIERELLTLWVVKKNVWFLWVMPVERVSYLACVLLKNVWFSVLCRLSVWVIVGVISSDTIRYCVCVCVRAYVVVVVVESWNYWES